MQFNDYSTKAISTLTDKDSHKYGDVDARLMDTDIGIKWRIWRSHGEV